MIGIDTNVLVRFLTQDDRAQAAKVDQLLDAALSDNERVHVDAVVLCELVWVLRAAYEMERTAIADALGRLLEASQISVHERDLVRDAVARYRKGPGDFADYVIALRCRAAGCSATATFDRAHRNDELFSVL